MISDLSTSLQKIPLMALPKNCLAQVHLSTYLRSFLSASNSSILSILSYFRFLSYFQFLSYFHFFFLLSIFVLFSIFILFSIFVLFSVQFSILPISKSCSFFLFCRFFNFCAIFIEFSILSNIQFCVARKIETFNLVFILQS